MTFRPSGLIPVLATPFDQRGALDLASLRRLVGFQLDSGVDGVATFGMASEAFALTAEERRRVLDAVTEVVGGAVPIVAGVNATSSVTAAEQAVEAALGGATALMVLPPFMVKPGPAGILDFYGDVAAASPLPVMVQDAPSATGVTMTADLIRDLHGLPNVTSVKVEASPSVVKVAAVRAAVGDDVAILGGQNALSVLDEHAAGAVGTMPACEFPDLLAPVLRSWESGRHDDARAGFARILPLVVAGLQPGTAWAVHKEVLVRRGLIDHATVRRPALPLGAGMRVRLDALIADLGLDVRRVALRG